MKKSTYLVVGSLLLLPIAVGVAVLAWWPSQAGAVGTIISGIATADVAILTVAVLLLNRQLVHANKAMADATKATADATKEVAEASREEAASSRQQAEATLHSLEELRTDRELLWAPQLLRTGRTRPGDPRSVGGEVVVRNLGRGPALGCVYAEFYGPGWQWASNFDVHAEGEVRIATEYLAAHPVQDLLAGPAPAGFGDVFICIDRLGYFWRFVQHRPAASGKWRGQGDPPGWVAWYQQVTRVDI